MSGRSAARSPGPGTGALAAVAGLAVALLVPRPAGAQLSLGGYVRSLTGVHDAGFDAPGVERRSAFNGEVARLKWRARWEGRAVVEVHHRIQARISSAEEGFGESVAGFGVSALPGRAVDLESTWIRDDRFRLWHDVDRLSVTVFTSDADVTVGRQAITWGSSLLFPVADLWTQFSPFELDTEEKPGVDALRVLAYPRSGLEVDGVVADLGERDRVSGGVRAAWSLPSAEIYAAAGRIWNEALAAGGVAWIFATTKLRAEVAAARDVDADRWLDPRATVGFDWIGPRVVVTAEYHFNGLGADAPADYPSRLRSEAFARGESYFLGRHYVGGLVAWTVDDEERVRVGTSALVNLGDPSGALLPTVTWDVGPSTSLSAGGLLTDGEKPAVAGGAAGLRSEYGSYGQLGYTRVSVYF